MTTPHQRIPLNHQYLLEALHAASSQSQELVQQASAQLKEWEKQAGYWTLLQDAFLDRSLPVELRWIAIITLKQGVDKYWRKTSQNAISKEEKRSIRARLLSSSIDETQSQLAVQNAVIVGKVVRLEYPLEWPKVFTDITAIIRQASDATSNGRTDEQASLRLTRSLSILLHVVKELATGRLSRTKSSLQSVTPEILKVLGDVYIRHVQVWQNLLGQPAAPAERTQQMMTISLSALKIMRRLIVAGYEFPNRAPEVNQAWSLLRDHVWVFFNADSEVAAASVEINGLLRKHVVNIGKVFLDVIAHHPAAFALLPGTLELLGRYWEVVVAHGETLAAQSKTTVHSINGASIGSNNGAAEDEAERVQRKFSEKVALQGMLLFRGAVKMIHSPTATFKYRHKVEKDEIKSATVLFKEQLFSPQTVTHCMEVLVTKYFILRPSDLEGWADDPEGWNEQWENAVESYEFLIRPCAEKLFNDLVVNYKDVLAQPLMTVFGSIESIAKDDILMRDAIYTAVGLAASVLHQNLNFDQFINKTLANEVQIAQPGYNIIRRRVAILIGQWVSVKISVETRPTLYKIMQHLLNREDPLNDLVVRLTAAHNLKRCVDEWDFRLEAFLPFVDDIFHKLMGLISESEQTETRMGLLDVIGMIVDRLEHRVAPYAEQIVQILPPLWEQTGDEHLFKQAILAILTKLIGAMKDKSVQYHHMVIPLIRYSVEPGSGMQVYLLEDALDLWEATVRATPAPASQELLDLFSYLIACMELASIALRKVLDIVDSYVLLAPREIIETYRGQLFVSFANLLGQLKPEGQGTVTRIVEVLIRVAKQIGGDAALGTVCVELVESRFLVNIFEGLRESYEANQTTGPNKRHPPTAMQISDYLSLLARIVIANAGCFLEVVRMVAERTTQQSVPDFMKWLLAEWFGHFANMGHPSQRKLNCFGLTMLLETNQPWILERLQDLMIVWTDVVVELRDEHGTNDTLVWKSAEDVSADPETPERTRRNQLTESDPVHSVDASELIKHHLEKVQNENGGPQAFSDTWVVNVDRDVLSEFAKLGLV
ncbi:armadillo-type protein [Tricharina praecox]|uniref:armadillo-type protein n=1 Tax=Tricharina praecox TaxID=43433 RepID=UPI002220C627|nr:armadillo-type protein [Tricharina praecox]KAI5844872.1 armadillo-type protein [Tricharina praecox]